MFDRRLILALPLLLWAGSAQAEDKKKDESKGAGQYVDLLPIALPVNFDGRLVNYIFVNVRINLTRSANAAELRTREPFFRDALVRAGHRTPFLVAGDLEKVDAAKISASLMHDAVAIAGPGVISSVVVTSQAPQRRVARPQNPSKP